MLETIDIRNIEFSDFTAKSGKDYTRCIITDSNGRQLSGFKSYATDKMHIGETVELSVEENGKYFNFKPATPTDKLEVRVENIEAFCKKLALKLNDLNGPSTKEGLSKALDEDQAKAKEIVDDLGDLGDPFGGLGD